MKEKTALSIAAVILAGGQAARMNGADKGLIELNGKPLIAYVVEALRGKVDRLFISANRNRTAYAEFSPSIIADTLAGFPGPLAGMAAALRCCGTDLLFVCPCDSPFLYADAVERLQRGMLAANADIAVASDGERPQPVFALLRCSLLASLQAFLDADERKIMKWYRQQNLAMVDFSDQPDTFININTPEERDAVERQLRNES